MPRHPYSPRYVPPAPVLPVHVSSPGATLRVLLQALVDTGAGISVLPQDLPSQLGLPRAGRIVVSGFEGVPRILPVYLAEIGINGYLSIIRAVCFGTAPLIGRDLLNRFVAHFYGPETAFDVEYS